MTDTYLFLTEWQPFGFGPNAKVTFKTKETYRRNQLLKQAVSGRRRRSASTASDLMLRVRTKGTDGVLFYANTAYSELILWVRHMRANHASHTIMSRVILQRVCVCACYQKIRMMAFGLYSLPVAHSFSVCVTPWGWSSWCNLKCWLHQTPATKHTLCADCIQLFQLWRTGQLVFETTWLPFFFSVTFTKLLPFL